MSKVLAIGVIILLYTGIAEALKCFDCKNVLTDNSCMTQPEATCNYGMFNICYTREIRKGGKTTEVSRGCSALCRSIKRRDYEENMICCVRELCNTHNFYTNDSHK